MKFCANVPPTRVNENIEAGMIQKTDCETRCLGEAFENASELDEINEIADPKFSVHQMFCVRHNTSPTSRYRFHNTKKTSNQN